MYIAFLMQTNLFLQGCLNEQQPAYSVVSSSAEVRKRKATIKSFHHREKIIPPRKKNRSTMVERFFFRGGMI